MTQYRVPVLEEFEWQQRVLSILSTPPGSPTKGDRHIVGATATGDWTGHENDITWYDGSTWQFDAPTEGWATWNLGDSTLYRFDGSDWVVAGEGDMLKSVYDTDDDGIVDAAEILDDGAGNTLTAAQGKEAYDKRGNYDTDLQAILFEL